MLRGIMDKFAIYKLGTASRTVHRAPQGGRETIIKHDIVMKVTIGHRRRFVFIKHPRPIGRIPIFNFKTVNTAIIRANKCAVGILSVDNGSVHINIALRTHRCAHRETAININPLSQRSVMFLVNARRHPHLLGRSRPIRGGQTFQY